MAPNHMIPTKRRFAGAAPPIIIRPSPRSHDNMPLPRFLSLPRKDRRSRSKARSEADASQDPSEAGLAAPHPPGPDSHLGAGSSIVTAVTPSTPKNRVPGGTQTLLPQNLHLTILPQNADYTVSDPTQAVTFETKRPKPWNRILNRSTTASEMRSESGLGSTMYASAKVVVDVVKESSDVFPPLKSVVGGLSVALKHYDVCCAFPPIPIHDADSYYSKQRPTDKRWNL